MYKWDVYGTKFKIIHKQPTETLVRVMCVEEGEQYDGRLFLLNSNNLHDEPPIEYVNKQISDKKEELKQLQEKVVSLREEHKNILSNAHHRMKTLKEHEALKQLDDFIDGRITHYVEISGYNPPTIIPLENTTCDYGKRDEFKLLTLYGSSKGDLNWKLNKYKDGSGSDDVVIPCTSLEEAQNIVVDEIHKHIEKALDPKERTTPRTDWLKAAKENGVSFHSSYEDKLKERKEQNKQAEIMRLKKKIYKLKNE